MLSHQDIDYLPNTVSTSASTTMPGRLTRGTCVGGNPALRQSHLLFQSSHSFVSASLLTFRFRSRLFCFRKSLQRQSLDVRLSVKRRARLSVRRRAVRLSVRRRAVRLSVRRSAVRLSFGFIDIAISRPTAILAFLHTSDDSISICHCLIGASSLHFEGSLDFLGSRNRLSSPCFRSSRLGVRREPCPILRLPLCLRFLDCSLHLRFQR